MPASYPRTESDRYENGRDQSTSSTLAVIGNLSRGGNSARSTLASNLSSSVTKTVAHSELHAHRNELNSPKPNTTYVTTNATGTLTMQYKTDSQGRTTEVHLKAEPTYLEMKTIDGVRPELRDMFPRALRDSIQKKIGQLGNPGDHGFHLVAACLGGLGQAVNLVPGSGRLNLSTYKNVEVIQKTFLLKGLGTETTISTTYTDDGGRPESFRFQFENAFFVGDFDMPNK